jgi:hypothetical protein
VTRASPACHDETAIASLPADAKGRPARRSSRAAFRPKSKRGSTRHRIGTRPLSPSTLRITSRIGASRSPTSSIASVTRTAPDAVPNVVSSTFDPSR